MTRVANLTYGRSVRQVNQIAVTDTEMTSGLTLNYPYGSFVRLIATNITVSGPLNITIAGGTPEQGEELTIEVFQGNADDGMITDLKFSGSANFYGFKDSDYLAPTAHPNTITSFRLYYSILGKYVLESTSLCRYAGVTDAFDFNGRDPSDTQKIFDAFISPWDAVDYTPTTTTASNPVTWNNGSQKSAVIWVTVLSSTNTGYLQVLYPSGNVEESTIGTIDGTIQRIAVRTPGNGSAPNVMIATDERIYGLECSVDSVGAITPGTLNNISILGVDAANTIYKDSDLDQFVSTVEVGGSSEIFSTNGDFSVGLVLKTMTGSIPVGGLARSPDGFMAAIANNGGDVEVSVSLQRTGTANTVWSTTATAVAGVAGESISWDRDGKRWLIYADDGLDRGEVWASTDENGTGWTQVSQSNVRDSLVHAIGSVQMSTSKNVNTPAARFIKNPGGSGFKDFRSSPFSATPRIVGFAYWNGYLMATTDTSQFFVSREKVGPWRLQDIDK